MFLHLLLLSCGPADTDTRDTGWAEGWTWTDTEDTEHTEDTEDTDPGTDTAPPSFVGTPPAEALGLPEFVVSNQYGLDRTADYLEGSPTVVWFFTTGWTDC